MVTRRPGQNMSAGNKGAGQINRYGHDTILEVLSTDVRQVYFSQEPGGIDSNRRDQVNDGAKIIHGEIGSLYMFFKVADAVSICIRAGVVSWSHASPEALSIALTS